MHIFSVHLTSRALLYSLSVLFANKNRIAYTVPIRLLFLRCLQIFCLHSAAAEWYYLLMTPVIANLGSPMHWFIFFVLVLIVFGAKRLPDIARNLGKGMAEFKKARKEFEKGLTEESEEEKAKKVNKE